MFAAANPPLLRSWICNRVYFVYQRSSGGQTIFASPHDYWEYLSRLFLLAHRYQVRVHGYALLPNHVRLLLEPRRRWSISRLMQHLQSGYARWKNHQSGRDGHLWKHHFGAQLVRPAEYKHALWSVEIAPVLLGFAKAPTRYRWSSARAHAAGPEVRIKIPKRGQTVSWPTIDLFWPPGFRYWSVMVRRSLFGWPDPQAWRCRFARTTSRGPGNRNAPAAAQRVVATSS